MLEHITNLSQEEKNLILHAPDGKLADNVTFKNYFRGLYFKTDHGSNPGPGNMAMLNFKLGKITLYYNEDKKKTVNTVVSYERVYKTYVLNLAGNTISLLQNSGENTDYLTAANSSNEASRVYLKGGEGSMAVIDLFGSTDLNGYTLNPAFNENLYLYALQMLVLSIFSAWALRQWLIPKASTA